MPDSNLLRSLLESIVQKFVWSQRSLHTIMRGSLLSIWFSVQAFKISMSWTEWSWFSSEVETQYVWSYLGQNVNAEKVKKTKINVGKNIIQSIWVSCSIEFLLCILKLAKLHPCNYKSKYSVFRVSPWTVWKRLPEVQGFPIGSDAGSWLNTAAFPSRDVENVFR